MTEFDLGVQDLRALNRALHALGQGSNTSHWVVLNPRGAHAVAAGVAAPVTIEIDGHVGYYCAGMNQRAHIVVRGNAGPGVAENMMSGHVHVLGDASQSAGATGHGGILVIEGNAAARCGISMKGIDIVVRGSVGHMSAFMAQSGTLIVFGDAGDGLGDSIYEAKLFVAGRVAGLGADCVEKPMREEHYQFLRDKLQAACVTDDVDIRQFRRFGSARALYHFHTDHADAY